MGRKWQLHGVGGLALTGVLVVGATGCSSDAEPESDQEQAATADADTSGGADLDIGDDGVSVQDDEGQGFSAQATTEVPDAIADLVPLPEGFTAEGTTETSLEGAESTMLIGTLDTEDPAAVMADLEEALSAEGLETLSNTDLDEMHTLSMFAEDEVQVTVAIVVDDDASEPAEMNVTVTRPTA